MTIEERLKEFKEQGYTIFSGVYSPEDIASWKAKYDDMVARSTPFGATEKKLWLSSAVELEPKLMLPVVNNPQILDFAERVMGPFVQLDNLTFMAFPSVDRKEVEGLVTSWHRDRWGGMPRGSDYVSPWSCNAITYLQDLTEEYGPLRVVKGSHRRPITMHPDDLRKPREDELVLNVKAGDVVFTHAGLLHTGTPNVSGKPRYFISTYYTRVGLRTTDNHGGPNVTGILNWARERQDRRLMRLFGEDPLLRLRANSGFTTEDEETWDKWIAEDRAVLQQ